jgi:hypothetical protein
MRKRFKNSMEIRPIDGNKLFSDMNFEIATQEYLDTKHCLDMVGRAETLDVKCDRLTSILDDFGIKDEQQLRDILKTFMTVTEELSHGMLSKLYTDADFLINYFRDREKVHAHWTPDLEGYVRCSHCNEHETNEYAIFFNYCPTCDAIMDEEV